MKYKTRNIKCPIACGYCCREKWFTVPELIHQYPFDAFEAKEKSERGEIFISCPHYTDNGCRIMRKLRPPACQSFLCKEACKELNLPDNLAGVKYTRTQ